MKRRVFIGSLADIAGIVTVGGSAAAAAAGRPRSAAPEPLGRRSFRDALEKKEITLAGKTLQALRAHFQKDLDEYVDFFIRHGIDFENGGFMCSLDHDGTLIDTNKYHWFQGRGIWVFSHLYNFFKKDPRYLEIAKKTCDFMLRYFPQDNEKMRWATTIAKDGKVVKPYENDPFGCYFGIEGMFELAAAAQDSKLYDQALDIYLRHYAFVRNPKTPFLAHPPGTRGFNVEMADLEIATQVLRRKDDPSVRKIADESVAAIMDAFWNPEISLFNEILDQNLKPYPELKYNGNPGHGVEVMWMVMEEALRRKDETLFEKAQARMRNCLEIGWDHVFGGMVHGVNVGQGCYEWPVYKPSGMTVEFRERGEFSYIKAHWAVSEVLIATIMAYEHSGAEWAADYFGRTKKIHDEKMSLRPHGYPLHLLFTDRKYAFQPHTMRKDNYHYMRALMHCIKALDRMIG